MGGLSIAAPKAPSSLRRVGGGLFSVLFPSDCRVCGLPLQNISRLLVYPKGKGRHRGFNQADLIAKAALKVHPARERCQLATGVLGRSRETQSQVGLTNRRENMRGAFAVTRAPLVTGRDVLLADDVYTTGMTVSECARVLRHAGGARVWVATVARTMKRASKGEGFNVSKFQGSKETIAPRPLETLETLQL